MTAAMVVLVLFVLGCVTDALHLKTWDLQLERERCYEKWMPGEVRTVSSQESSKSLTDNL